MSRTISSGATADHSTVVDFLRAYYWTGSAEQAVQLCTATQDMEITIDAVPTTFNGAGLMLQLTEVQESTDYDAVGVDISLDGVDQTVVAILMNNQFIGRKIEVWRAWFDDSTGLIIGNPVKLFEGVQNDPYTITSSQTYGEYGASTVTTRAVTKMTRVQFNAPVYSNPVSHNEMLTRAADGVTYDTFFNNVKRLKNRSIDWGGESTPLNETGVDRPTPGRGIL